VPAVTWVGGLPDIVSAAVTLIEKPGSELVCVPSVTLTTILEKVPTWLPDGVPDNAPVEVLNNAQAG
jgi:hypothetical protein